MTRPLVVGNWKAYVGTLKEARTLFKQIEKGLPRTLKAEVVVCPPASFLGPLSMAYQGRRLMFGAQDASSESGAHTGEIAASTLASVGAEYVIVGHAERRALGDTDEIVAKKLGAVLEAGMTPIVCVGEAARDRDGQYLTVLEQSILASLARVEERDLKRIVIAYEPVWAVGAREPIPARDIREAIIFIRKALASRFSREAALKIRVLYGGAVDPDHVASLVTDAGASGLLLGRASVTAESFISIIRAYSR